MCRTKHRKVMINMGNVKKQHYVPQRYLHAFATRKSPSKPYKFFIYDKELDKTRNGNVEDYASERYFYDIDFEKIKEDVIKKDPNFKIDPEIQELQKEADPHPQKTGNYYFRKDSS